MDILKIYKIISMVLKMKKDGELDKTKDVLFEDKKSTTRNSDLHKERLLHT